jgi:tetratricopeptide (TPR) repeat protein
MTESRARRPRQASAAHRARRAAENQNSAAALGLGPICIAMVALFPIAAMMPGTWLWGINALRFVSAATGRAIVAVLALSLIPPLSRRAAALLDRTGAVALRRPALAAAGWGLVLAATAWVLCDRTLFLGDFFLRIGAAQKVDLSAQFLPQALPFDLWLHTLLPRALNELNGIPPVAFERVLGVIKAILFGASAVAIAARPGRGGVAFALGVAAASGGTALALFTGYPKGLSEVAVLTALFVAAGLGVPRSPRAFALAALACAAALVTHRAAIALLPAFAVLVWNALRPGNAPRGGALALAIGAGLLVMAAVGWLVPHLARAWQAADAEHLFPNGAGPWAALQAAFAPLHLLDALNVALAYAPLTPLLVLLPATWRRIEREPGAGAFWLALLVPAIATLLFVHPRQGAFRDLDVYAVAGVTLAAFTAWAVPLMLPARGEAGWVAVPAAAIPLASMLLVLSMFHVTTRGIRRAQSFIIGPPARSSAELALTWRYLGSLAHQVGFHDQALEAYQKAASYGPSPAALTLIALEAMHVGDMRLAQQTYREVSVLTPRLDVWLDLARTSCRIPDWSEAHRAAEQVLALDPHHEEAQRILADSERAMAAEHGGSPKP